YQHQPDSLAQLQYAAFAGIRRDSRSQFTNTGPEAGAEIRAKLFPYSKTEFGSGRISAARAWLGPRVYQQIAAEGFYEKELNAFSTISAKAGYFTTISEDYVTGTIQRIKSDTLTGQLQWHYQLLPELVFKSDNLLALPARQFHYRQHETQSVTRQNFSYNQLDLNLQQELNYSKNRLRASLQFLYRERDRSYQLQNNLNLSGTQLESAANREKIKDIRESTTAWLFSADYLLTKRHSITAQSRAQLLRLDTPSEENDQDRDEVHYVGKLQLNSRWGNNFRTTFALAGEQRQFVFIKAAQSAENYTDHILRYEPGFTWAPGRFSIRSQYQLWVTYHVRALTSEQLKNRSDRTLYQQYELSYSLNRNWRTSLLYNRRENRLSLLNWQKFTESPLDTTISNDLTLSLQKRFRNEFSESSLRLGYRYFEQRIQNRNGLQLPDATPKTIYLHNITRQHGPELTAEYRHSKYRLDFYASVWLQQLHTFYSYATTETPFLGPALSLSDLNRKQKHFYPTFEVSLNWQFRSM
ncbi:MAG: hypothetical protein LPK19_10920, partial [Hymenobacteraceae bacterium]|nr:hypothetical protein [Hymenobacteraceae bacterium]MDX5396746.1 hypothetical protein [Hymenobacteraceae bacterium]MDX5512808.1 hypothetical protein [Hymenobacteraceae bacterium]